jgi:predicted nucleic acid-binding protein
MYNKDLLTNKASILEIRKLKINRRCNSCGHMVKKETPMLIRKRASEKSRLVICPECCGEIYFRALTKTIELTQEQKDKIEREVDNLFDQRITLLLKDYSSEAIIKEVLRRKRGK